MMTLRLLPFVAATLLALGCSRSPAPTPESATPAEAGAQGPRSGILHENFDRSVPVGTDFYRHVNGTWLATTPIPPDKSNHGAFSILSDQAEEQVHAILTALAAGSPEPGTEDHQLAALYRSFMDEARVEALGAQPLEPLLARIEALESHDELPALVASLAADGLQQPFSFWISQDAKDATRYTVYFSQFGQLGLPDRSFYLDEGERFQRIRAEYLAYLERLFGLLDYENARGAAERLLAMETRIAQAHWTRVEARDRDKTYNPVKLAELNALTPGVDLRALVDAVGITTEPLIVMQPSAITAMAEALRAASLEEVKAFLSFGVVNQLAPYLSSDFVNARFDFYGRVISGVEELQPRWKRAVAFTESAMGEAVGKRYVERHFPPAAKARMDEMVRYLLKAYEASIRELDWMTEATREKALEKLSKFTTKIGYPDVWRDYSALTVAADDLIGNVLASQRLETARQLAKLGQPVDRNEWFMTPQTVNAYYNPGLNEIVFPAAILQPPFFDLEADDAVNYGAIGAVIGHEIGHGFDDQGSKYDGDGNLRNWWTDEDRKAFEARTRRLIGQYDRFCPLEGHCVQGALSLGENIGDLGGLSIALKAYRMSLEGREPPLLDGYTADQRFFIGWAQIWARNYREEELIARLRTGPHAPNEFRANGIVRNLPDWYAAFDIGPDAPMYLPQAERVRIW